MKKANLLHYLKTADLADLLIAERNPTDRRLLRDELVNGRRNKVSELLVEKLGDSLLEAISNKQSPYLDLIRRSDIEHHIQRNLSWNVGLSFRHFLSADREKCATISAFAEKVNQHTPEHIGHVAKQLVEHLEKLYKIYKLEKWDLNATNNSSLRETQEALNAIKATTDWNEATLAIADCISIIAALEFLHDRPDFNLAIHDAVTAMENQTVFELAEPTQEAIKKLWDLPVVALAVSARATQAKAAEEVSATYELLASLSNAGTEVTLRQLNETMARCEATHALIGKILPGKVREFQDSSNAILGRAVDAFVAGQIAQSATSGRAFDACTASVITMLGDIKNRPLYPDLPKRAIAALNKSAATDTAYWAKWVAKVAPAIAG